MYQEGHIDIISLGCSKNLIDSERLLKKLTSKGYTTSHDPECPKGEFVVVNTCGFISDAKEESINLILQLCELKKQGEIGKVVVMGCLSQRYMEDLKKEIPEVDIWYGKYDWSNFIQSLKDRKHPKKVIKDWERIITTPSHSAYLKISEGCDRYCAFCAIPVITGRHKSRPMEEILEEVESLIEKGVKELNVIAQDLSSYGKDIYGRQALPELIDKIADKKGIEWIRLHYLYPSDFPLEILDVMNSRENVCNYLDIALQHISDNVLANMKRHISKRDTLTLLKTIKQKVPGIKLRTTLMTGFPGEGETEFDELKQFVREQNFDRMGAFTYCEEEDTMAAKNFEDSIPSEIKEKRLSEIMTIQEEISLKLNEKMIGKVEKVLIDRIEDDRAIGRTQYDSPDVDNEVIIFNNTLKPGNFVNVKFIRAYTFELIGEII